MTVFVAPLQAFGHDDVEQVGGKGANLGELLRAGLPVPPGFAITADAFLEALEEAGVRDELREVFASASSREAELDVVSAELRSLVAKATLPSAIRAAVLDAYHTMGNDVVVAVRSSATAEDTGTSSFAGMHTTFTNVVGDDELVERVRDCWTSLYGERVVSYRLAQHMTEEPAIAVVVQQMVDSLRSGVMFTADPATGDERRIVIEAAFGLGEVVVSGQVEPDTYVVDKDGLRLQTSRIGHKTHKIIRGVLGHDEVVELSDDDGYRRVLSDDEVVAVARLGLAVEQHYGEPQDTEWAMTESATFLVQSRPITTLSPVASGTPSPNQTMGQILVSGLAAAPGWAIGAARVLRSPTEGRRLLDGEVLVAPMTNPDWVPTIRRAAAVVTDGGGMTCHAAIVARELGVPCVVGARNATSVLRDGEVVTVDGTEGTVSEGARAETPRAMSAVVAPSRDLSRHRTSRYAAVRQPGHGRARGGSRGVAMRRRWFAAG